MQAPVGFGDRIVLRAPEARWMVLAADFCHVAKLAMLAWLHEEVAGLNTVNKMQNGFFDLVAEFSGKVFR
jgi:hypothetical protein